MSRAKTAARGGTHRSVCPSFAFAAASRLLVDRPAAPGLSAVGGIL